MYLFKTVWVFIFAWLISLPTAHALDRISLSRGANGPVYVISEPDNNGIRYVGGSFTLFDQWQTGAGVLTDPTTGAVNPSFPLITGTVYAVASDGRGGHYIGGTFTQIDGNSSCPRVAHINADGSLDTTWCPKPNGNVLSIVVSGDTVYLGGDFTTVGATPISRNRAAAYKRDGTLTNWDPNMGSTVWALTTSSDGSTIYLGGQFTTAAGGVGRVGVAAFDTYGNLSTWNPIVSGQAQRVYALAYANNMVYMGGDFDTLGGAGRGRAGAVDATTGAVTAWNPSAGNVVSALAVSGSVVYLGGTFTNMGAGGFNVSRSRAAAVDATTGNPTSWNPVLNEAVNAIAVSGDKVYLAGNFTSVGASGTVNFSQRLYAVAVNASDAKVSGAGSWRPNPNALVRAMAISDAGVLMGGDFTKAGGLFRNNAAAIDSNGAITDWDPVVEGGGTVTSPAVYAIAVSGTKVYLGGNFGKVAGTARQNVASVDTSGNLQSFDVPGMNGPVYTMAMWGDRLIMGGGWTFFGNGLNPYGVMMYRPDGTRVDNFVPHAVVCMSGPVRALAVTGNTLYMGNNYCNPYRGLVSLDLTNTETALPTLNGWNSGFSSGTVSSLMISNGTLYVGGTFSSAGGSARNNAAAFDIATGNLTTWNPNASSSVLSLSAAGTKVYMGGLFTSVGGTTRNYAAAVDASSAALDSTWNPNFSVPVTGFNAPSGGDATAIFAISADGNNTFSGGNFTKVGNTNKSFFAKVSSTNVLDTNWPGAVLPVTPAKPVAVLGNGQATITVAMGTGSGATPAWYKVSALPGGQSCTFVGSSGNCTVTGLTNGARYTFIATAASSSGLLVTSAASDPTVPYTVPGAPTIGTATAGNASASVSFTAPASNGGSAITGYTVTSNPGNITGSGSTSPITVTGLTNGTAYTFTVTATNTAGTSAASAASNSVTPSNGITNQTITFANPGAQNFGNTFTLTATASSGLTVTFTSITSAVCSVSGSTLSLVGVGTCSINANQAGNGATAPAATVAQSFTVSQATQTITFNNPGTQNSGSTPTLTATATSGLPITFSSSTTGVCTVAGSTLSFATTGTCTVTASQVGNSNYMAASAVQQSFSVATLPGAPTIGTATAGNASASVSFTAPASNGGSAITGYTVTSNPGNRTGSGSTSPITVTGLTNGTAYTFTVTATNAVGTGAASAASNAATPMASGACGTAGSVTAAFVPTRNLCSAGTASSVTSSAGNWGWSCVSPTGNASCTAPQQSTSTASAASTHNWQVNTANTAGFIPLTGHVKSPPLAPPSWLSFPHGLIDFQLDSGTPSSAATVTLNYPTALPAGTAYWKFGPEPGNAVPHWYAFAGAVISSDRKSITLTLTDGGAGDSDSTLGTITDPGGPAVEASAAQATPIPTLGEWAMALLVSLMALLAMRRTGHFRHQLS